MKNLFNYLGNHFYRFLSTKPKSKNGCQKPVCFSLLLVLVTFLFLTNVAFSQWQNTGGIYCQSGSATISSSYSSLWMGFQSSGGYCKFSKCLDSNWITLGTFGNGGEFGHMYSDPEIVVNGDTLFAFCTVDWYYHQSSGTELRVYKYSNGNWNGIYTFSNGYPGGFIPFTKSIAIFHNMPVVAYYCQGYFPDCNDLRILRLEEGSWIEFGYPNGGNHNELNDHFTLEADDSSIYIAGLDSSGSILVKQLFDSSSVDIGSPGNTGERIKSLNLKLINGQLYVSFSDRDNGFRTSVKKYDGTNWNYVGLPGFSDGPSTDIHLSNNGNVPYVAFNDSINIGITVMRFNGLQWSPEGEPGFKKQNWGSNGRQNITVFDGNVYVALTLNDTDFCSGSNYVTTMGYGNNLLPVELASYTSTINQRNVTLNWVTSLETNNSGFDIERKSVTEDWSNAGFVAGHGTVTYPVNYSFTDRNLAPGVYNYRLKQIDINGNFQYFNLNNEVIIGIPSKFEVYQNFPNPFNPSTKISFDLPVDSKVNVAVFDLTGKEIVTLVNDVKTAGYYTVDFNATGLSSGIYFYRISAGSFTATKKMMLIR